MVNPLEQAAQRSIDKAIARGGHDLVVWLPDEGCWGIPSESQGGELRRVWRTKPLGDRFERFTDAEGRKKVRGHWWFFFACDCPAAGTYQLCWHKAAVYLWCKQWRNFDPRERPLDAKGGGSYHPSPLAPDPADTATILQVAGPATQDLSETIAQTTTNEGFRERYGEETYHRYLEIVRDEGPAEALAWLAKLDDERKRIESFNYHVLGER